MSSLVLFYWRHQLSSNYILFIAVYKYIDEKRGLSLNIIRDKIYLVHSYCTTHDVELNSLWNCLIYTISF